MMLVRVQLLYICCNKIPDWLTDAKARTLLFYRSLVPVLAVFKSIYQTYFKKYSPPITGLFCIGLYIYTPGDKLWQAPNKHKDPSMLSEPIIELISFWSNNNRNKLLSFADLNTKTIL